MKRTSVIVMALLLCLTFVLLTACQTEHICQSKCEVCGKCTDTECKDSVCADKCEGHPTHECTSVCDVCGKCTDAECTDSVCADKCEGHPTHECTSICDVCRRCTDAECTDSACEVKCAGHETMYAVVVSVPESWTSPNLWAWRASDGLGAFPSWPGEPFEKLENGKYICYVPGFVDTIIVNANQGGDDGVQTDGITIEAAKNALVTVAEDKTATVAELPASEKIPEYVEKFVIHANVPLSWETVQIWAWSHPDGKGAFTAWPGEALKAEMKDGNATGWYTGKLPTWINRLIVNGNGATDTEKTPDMPIGEPKEMWITVAKDLSYTISYTDPDKAVENITVYAQLPSDWTDPACWAWSAPDGTNAFPAWPGEALTKDGEWYKLSVPGWINSVIINGNVGGSVLQTVDLSVEKGKDVWVVVTSSGSDGKFTATIAYEEPAK